MANPPLRAIDIACNLHEPGDATSHGGGLSSAFRDLLHLDDQARTGAGVDVLLDQMDRAGIERSFLIAVRAGDMRIRGSFEIPYARVAQICARHPDRFSGLAGIDPTRGMAGLRDLENAVRDMGFVGAHLYPHWFAMAPDHARYYPYYAKCCELDVPIQVQVGHALIYDPDRPLRSVGQPMTLDTVACDFPELKLVGTHIGVPWTDEMISVAFKHPNVRIATDAHPPRHWPASLIDYLAKRGVGKVMFGTDWPVVDPVRARNQIDAMEISTEARNALLRESALAFYRIMPNT
ncbi:hypothetical protein P775_24795 [Puniceibacterium antarcticum]|uniref:Amidohydrolase-related domain-containing protein n=1 Tax=Puniceibacterium antarcticum TaxID=1206336 RepID=A0A2G8R6I5_9RHOB|nr:amidohydrolase family protein [Puniceibacterium antarcticum]PIL17147.1 hypothetical protein P775_24795 [Puniceibacterium antarcticum]